MGTDESGNGAVGGQIALCLSSDDTFLREKQEVEVKAERQKAYYAEWKTRHERVSGSLAKEIHAEVRPQS